MEIYEYARWFLVLLRSWLKLSKLGNQGSPLAVIRFKHFIGSQGQEVQVRFWCQEERGISDALSGIMMHKLTAPNGLASYTHCDRQVTDDAKEIRAISISWRLIGRNRGPSR